MSEPIICRVADLIGGPRAINVADGEKVFWEILPMIQKTFYRDSDRMRRTIAEVMGDEVN